MSKRLLGTLVEEKLVEGWDDPRMPTLAGLRRRGFTPEAIRLFCDRIGVAKADSTVDVELLQNTQRELLNVSAKRALCVHRPLKVIVENWDEGRIDEIDAPFHPERPEAGSRKLPFTRELFIERDDFAEAPPKGFKRLSPGKEVRLRHAYVLRCTGVSRLSCVSMIGSSRSRTRAQARPTSASSSTRARWKWSRARAWSPRWPGRGPRIAGSSSARATTSPTARTRSRSRRSST